MRRGLFTAPSLPWSALEGDPAGLLPCDLGRRLPPPCPSRAVVLGKGMNRQQCCLHPPRPLLSSRALATLTTLSR